MVRGLVGTLVGLRGVDAPDDWIDQHGIVRPVPRGRKLKSGHETHRAVIRFVRWRDAGPEFWTDNGGRHRCRSCGSMDEHFLVTDHVISIANGGCHHPLNLITLCSTCNSMKVSIWDVPMRDLLAGLAANAHGGT